MNKLITILILAVLALPVSTLAQPEDDRGPRERPSPRERGDRDGRPGDRERPSDRFRPGERDRERDGDRQRSSQRASITVEQIPQAIATLRDIHSEPYPTWIERIETMADEEPEEAARKLSRFPRLSELMQMREQRPEEFQLHAGQSKLMREIFNLIRQIREALREDDQAKVDELKPQLREKMEQAFDYRLKIKQLELDRDRQKLADAERELAEIQADRDALIDQKIEQMLTGRGGPRGPHEDGERPERPGPDRPGPPHDRPDRE